MFLISKVFMCFLRKVVLIYGSPRKVGGNLLIGKEFQNSENETPEAFHFSEPGEIENFALFEIRAIRAVVLLGAHIF